MMSIENLEKIGNRWTKNGMDRVYFSFKTLEDICDKYNDGVVPMNRRQRETFKLWVDLENGEVGAKNAGNLEEELKQWTKKYIEEA